MSAAIPSPKPMITHGGEPPPPLSVPAPVCGGCPISPTPVGVGVAVKRGDATAAGEAADVGVEGRGVILTVGVGVGVSAGVAVRVGVAVAATVASGEGVTVGVGDAVAAGLGSGVGLAEPGQGSPTAICAPWTSATGMLPPSPPTDELEPSVSVVTPSASTSRVSRARKPSEVSVPSMSSSSSRGARSATLIKNVPSTSPMGMARNGPLCGSADRRVRPAPGASPARAAFT